MARVNVKVVRNRASKLKGLSEEVIKGVKKAVRVAGTTVRNDAILSIAQGSKSGVVYRKYNPSRVHKASAAGEAPATDTGYLVSNINLVMDTDGLGCSVDSRADYSSFLEFGTSKMSARPFLQPALEQNKNSIQYQVWKATKDALKKGDI